MIRWLIAALVCVALLEVVRADHFTVELKLQASKQSQTAQTDTQAIGVKTKPRKVMTVKAGERLTLHWKVINVSAKESFKNVLIHLMAVPEEKVGQVNVPKAKENVAAESAAVMDFNPGEKAKGDLVFTIERPGIYLVRVETIGAAAGPEGHEHFAALDLMVE